MGQFGGTCFQVVKCLKHPVKSVGMCTNMDRWCERSNHRELNRHLVRIMASSSPAPLIMQFADEQRYTRSTIALDVLLC